MDKRQYKDRIYTVLARLVKAMANPRRLEIIDLLAQSERSVEEIARETSMSVANASQHLQVLKQSNLVQVKRDGNFILYSLANDNVYKSWKDLREIGMESLAEVEKIVRDFRGKKKQPAAGKSRGPASQFIQRDPARCKTRTGIQCGPHTQRAEYTY